MKKVVYSIRKVKGNFDEKISGLGFLNDEGTLFCKCVSKNGKRYTRAFDDVEKNCHPILGKENEFKGYVTMYYEYEGRDTKKNGTKCCISKAERSTLTPTSGTKPMIFAPSSAQ